MIKIEYMKDEEAEQVKNLIIDVFNERVAPFYTPEGISRFRNMLSTDVLVEMNNGSDSFVIVAKDDEVIVGMLAIIKMNHIGLVFVDTKQQKGGIGKRLINSSVSILKERNPYLSDVTVSSSPNSLSFYESVGFYATEPETEEEGMRYTSMKKDL